MLRGYTVVGPRLRDGVVVLDRIEGADDLPRGVLDEHGMGKYATRTGGDGRFGYSVGPDSAKRFLFPPREQTLTLRRGSGLIEVEEEPSPAQRLALIGLRPCDLHALAVLDRVFLGGPSSLGSYAVRRENTFIVAVNCTNPGENCFCASMGAGPACSGGYDLAIIEAEGRFLVETGSQKGAGVLDAIGAGVASDAQVAAAERALESAKRAIKKRVDTEGLPALFRRHVSDSRWEEIGQICLACGNCTAVCPTCFCHDIVDAVDLDGTTATRTRVWASCLSAEFSHAAGGPVRRTVGARYRQWRMHKFSSWIDQFGTLGCVGCGRCITWCPAGIDITEEIQRFRDSEAGRRRKRATA